MRAATQQSQLIRDEIAGIAENLSVRFGISLTYSELKTIERWLRDHDYGDLLIATAASCERHLRWRGKEIDPESWKKAFRAIPRTIRYERECREKPYLPDLYYTQGILRNRIGSAGLWCIPALETFVEAGVSPKVLQAMAKRAENWTDFIRLVDAVVAKLEEAALAELDSMD